MKTCARCKIEKPANPLHFSGLKKSKDGLHSWCKTCCAEKRREDRAARPEHYAEIERRRHEKHRAKRNALSRAAWASMSQEARERERSRQKLMRGIYNENRRQRFADDPARRESRSVANKAWRQKEAERLRERRRKKWKAATPTQRLRSYFGAAISHSLKGRGKGGRGWQEIAGYTAAELKSHIEKQFLKGMDWSNYGAWHIDHIVPASSFSYEHPDDPDFMACWALSNLRPLWAKDNIRKRDRRLYLI